MKLLLIVAAVASVGSVPIDVPLFQDAYRRVEMPFSMLPAPPSFNAQGNAPYKYEHKPMQAQHQSMPAERYAGPNPLPSSFVQRFPKPVTFASSNNNGRFTSSFSGGVFGGSKGMGGGLIGMPSPFPFKPPTPPPPPIRRPAKLCEQMVKTAQSVCGPRRVVPEVDPPMMEVDPTIFDVPEPAMEVEFDAPMMEINPPALGLPEPEVMPAGEEEVFDAEIMPAEDVAAEEEFVPEMAPEEETEFAPEIAPEEPMEEEPMPEEEFPMEEEPMSDPAVTAEEGAQWAAEEEPMPEEEVPMEGDVMSHAAAEEPEWAEERRSLDEGLYRMSPMYMPPPPPPTPAVLPVMPPSHPEKKEQRRLVLQAAIFVMNSGSAAEMEINCEGFHDAMDTMKGGAMIVESAPTPEEFVEGVYRLG